MSSASPDIELKPTASHTSGEHKYGEMRASPQQDVFVKRWFKQLLTMCRINATLVFVRYWRSTFLNIISPIFFLLLLLLIRLVSLNYGVFDQLAPQPSPLDGVRPCTPGYRTHCFTMMFAPDNVQTREIMKTFYDNNLQRIDDDEPFSVVSLTNFDPPKENHFFASAPNSHFVSDYILANPNITFLALTFDIVGDKYSYEIWYNQTLTVLTTDRVRDQFAQFLSPVMRGIDEAIIEYSLAQLGQPKITLDTSIKAWPIKKSQGLSETITTNAGPLFFFCSAMVNFMLLLNTVVQEKEFKLRHGMQVMGLMPSVYWTSHLLINVVIILLSSLVTCAFGIAFDFPIFSNTDFSVKFVLFFLFSLSMIFFSFFLSTLVRKTKTATMVGIFLLIVGLVFMYTAFTRVSVGYIWWESKTSPAGWIVLMFFPPFNFGKLYLDMSILSAGLFDVSTDTTTPGPGFHWDDLYLKIPFQYIPRNGEYSAPPPIQSVHFMIMNIFFYGFLSWYLDNVIPDIYGNSKSLYFFFLPSYWGLSLGKSQGQTYNLDAMLKRAEAELEDEDVHRERFRALDDNQSRMAAVRLLYLRKEYKPFFARAVKKKVAVDGSCWTLQEGRLLALLGQNGAGKSSTISMLCGFSKPSSGEAFIFGRSVHQDMEEIRSFMGVCPQHDVLFNDLTAWEHMILFCGIKNIPYAQVQALAEDRLGAVRLLKVKNRKVGGFSGGMKRRLSVAISTLGDPRIIFMDEPTTGMDPVNRRHVWSFLENFKSGRAIILTTHSMEEADILGDDVAIMALGRLRAFGSSIHLKGKFGAGYRISLVCDVDKAEEVKAHTKALIPSAILEDDSVGALAFQIPNEAMGSLSTLVRQLEQKELAGVRDWGISQSTLEDVFLKIIRTVNPTSLPKSDEVGRLSI